MTQAKGRGYAKVILFGEHFVVINMPGIVAGLSNIYTELVIKNEGRWSNNLDEDAVAALSSVASALGVENKGFEVDVVQTVPIKRNLGSSAALCVAFARALNDYYGLGKNDEEINKAAYEGEVVFHGAPSGIDNSSSTYGGALDFRKTNTGEFKIKKLQLKQPLYLLIVDCGNKQKGTGALVNDFLEDVQKPVTSCFLDAYTQIYQQAHEALNKGDVEYLGYLMNLNHGLLTGLGKNSGKIERARDLLSMIGAKGSKISGAGSGGNIIALFKYEEEVIRAKHMMEQHGYPSISATVQ